MILAFIDDMRAAKLEGIIKERYASAALVTASFFVGFVLEPLINLFTLS